jgi:signal transduction histidine kinase
VVTVEGAVVGEGQAAFHSVVAAPLQFGVDTHAVLLLFFRSTSPFVEDDRELIQHFCSFAAAAIAMAGMAREQQRRRYEERERTRHAIIQSVLHTVGNQAGVAMLAADSLAERLEGTGVLTAGARRDLEQIQSSADRLGQIMSELLRQDTNADSHVDLKLYDAVRVVTRTVERDHYDRIILKHDINPELRIVASEYLFRQAVDNLVHNAVQAMLEADGGGELRISTSDVEREWNGQVRRIILLDVEDSGPGVLPDFRDRIWEFGFTTRGEGHGHGLYYTRGLVTMLGGDVKLMEEPSELGGACFRVFIPAAKSTT